METKEFDYSKTYYKVTNEDECHNGYQYKDGLNILEEEFNDNPEHSCVPGGFYFTDYEYLPEFLNYGIFIREVSIPEDARVVKDPQGDKWRTDKIIFGNRYHIEKDFDQWFDKERFNYYFHSSLLIKRFSNYFDVWFDAKKIDWKYDSKNLAKYCPEHFDKWFDDKKFNWRDVEYLAQYCHEHFDKWFDAKKFYWIFSNYLAEYCSKHFDKWFDKEKFKWNYSNYLVLFCSQHFNKWFDPQKFNWDYSDILCNSQFTLWKQEHPELLQYVPVKYR